MKIYFFKFTNLFLQQVVWSGSGGIDQVRSAADTRNKRIRQVAGDTVTGRVRRSRDKPWSERGQATLWTHRNPGPEGTHIPRRGGQFCWQKNRPFIAGGGPGAGRLAHRWPGPEGTQTPRSGGQCCWHRRRELLGTLAEGPPPSRPVSRPEHGEIYR